jgi:hypothetical protein
MKLIIHYLTGLAVYGICSWFGFWLLLVLAILALTSLGIIER